MRHFECMSSIEGTSRLQKDVLALAGEYGASDKNVGHLLLILEELLTNIRLYAYKEEPGRVGINASLLYVSEGERVLYLEIIDWGPPFNPLLDSAPPDLESDIEERAVGGLGIYFVRSLARDLSYVRINDSPPAAGENRLRLSIVLG